GMRALCAGYRLLHAAGARRVPTRDRPAVHYLRGTTMPPQPRSVHPPRRSRRRGAIAASVALAMLSTMSAGATSALALPIDEVPANPAEWATSPYSPLEPTAIAAPNNALQLDFTGAEGGLNATGDVGTGFTMVQPS